METTTFRSINRRQLIGGIGAAGLATAVGGKLAFAQESTPSTESTATTDADTVTDLMTMVDQAIADAQADRAAVTGIDFTAVDQLIDQALNLRDQAAAATDTEEQRRLAGAAIRSANSSGAVIEALLATFGLPSKQIRSSVVLAAVHEGLTELATEVGTDNADAVTFVEIAQALYADAYDAYGAGTYTSATHLALAAGRVGAIAVMLTADGPSRGGIFGRIGEERGKRGGFFGGRERGELRLGDGPFGEGGFGDGSGFGGDRPTEPVEVPAPTFN